MAERISLTENEELHVQIENIIFRLLIHKAVEPTARGVGYPSMHTHVSTELFLCQSGEITVKLPSGALVLRAGDAALIPPGIRHYRSAASKDAVARSISFLCHKRTGNVGTDLYKILSPFVISRQVSVYRGHPELYGTVDGIIKESARDKLLPVMHMIELLMRMSGMPHECHEPLSQDSPTADGGNDLQRMMKLDQLINVFFAHDLSLAEAARHLYISTRQLDRIVRARYGKTLRRVIADKRISAACEMLTETDMTVDKICAAVGFKSKPCFYREFSRLCGKTPAEYRNENTK